MKPTKVLLSNFSEEVVAVPDFAPGSFGMDQVIRGDMDDREWRRWVSLTKVSEVKQLMGKYRREHGTVGLRDAVVKFLLDNNITVRGYEDD